MAVPSPGEIPQAATLPRSIVLYDGTCGLCHRSVKWILTHERDQSLYFAPLQGETAAALRQTHPDIPALVETVVLVDGDAVRLRTKALFHVARHLRAPWSVLYKLRWLPAFLLDIGYQLVARVRYRIWGRADLCELPSPAQRARFLP